ncbi:MAG: hypothetical protein OER22_08960 [Gammaproteobacteria bacterium]|nr:hypothetical protein [Gammaproteobacteria bacterium]MDH3374403.1 hypothetical protein [Gammaproteobacteria bacterium]MDH3408120.1 hypothetical protein [Gammaproteobacteria bacterium]MDH3552727.1 hypothetical protein [Gammaproteobacteria bacterium]
MTIDVDRPGAIVEEPVDTEGEDDPADEEADMRAKLASLRNVIG